MKSCSIINIATASSGSIDGKIVFFLEGISDCPKIRSCADDYVITFDEYRERFNEGMDDKGVCSFLIESEVSFDGVRQAGDDIEVSFSLSMDLSGFLELFSQSNDILIIKKSAAQVLNDFIVSGISFFASVEERFKEGMTSK